MEEPENAVEPAEEPAEASLDEMLAKKEEEPAPEEEGEEESVLETGRDERVESLSVKVVPQQPTEFVCKNCFLVKHRSQLADKKRMYCVDCA
ncbi:MAG TPA: DUF4193 family protein [Actinomycetota bacterium]|nr:DUF4193 family protein [Actinomycetota bacterium]